MEKSKLAVKNLEVNRDIISVGNGELRLDTISGGVEAETPETRTHRDLGQQVAPEQLALRPQKDAWDKIAALAPIISAVLIFLTGGYCTYTYNQQQIRIQQCQTIEKFIPHLMGNEQTKKAAILALSTLINTETASKFAAIFASTGTVSALQSLSQNGTEKDKSIATQALSTALQNLAESESKLSTIEQAYKQEIAEKSKLSVDNRDTPYNLNKLAQLYIIRGQYSLAEPLLKRSLEIRERVYGLEHPEVVDALKSLAELYQLSGKPELAETTLKRARDIEEKEGLNGPNSFNGPGASEHVAPVKSDAASAMAEPAGRVSKAQPAEAKTDSEKQSVPAPPGEAHSAEQAIEQSRLESKQQ